MNRPKISFLRACLQLSFFLYFLFLHWRRIALRCMRSRRRGCRGCYLTAYASVFLPPFGLCFTRLETTAFVFLRPKKIDMEPTTQTSRSLSRPHSRSLARSLARSLSRSPALPRAALTRSLNGKKEPPPRFGLVLALPLLPLLRRHYGLQRAGERRRLPKTQRP